MDQRTRTTKKCFTCNKLRHTYRNCPDKFISKGLPISQTLAEEAELIPKSGTLPRPGEVVKRMYPEEWVRLYRQSLR